MGLGLDLAFFLVIAHRWCDACVGESVAVCVGVVAEILLLLLLLLLISRSTHLIEVVRAILILLDVATPLPRSHSQ